MDLIEISSRYEELPAAKLELEMYGILSEIERLDRARFRYRYSLYSFNYFDFNLIQRRREKSFKISFQSRLMARLGLTGELCE